MFPVSVVKGSLWINQVHVEFMIVDDVSIEKGVLRPYAGVLVGKLDHTRTSWNQIDER